MSKYHIKFVLTKYVKCYDLSTGFCSVRYWRTRIEKKLYSLHEKIHDNLDFFYFEESYFKMCKKFLVCFCSMLVRLYLNYAMEHFCELISTIKLSDEKFVIEKILTFAYELLHDFLDTNYLFYYEFYNVLNEENLSDCYRVASNKPKFGPYIRPQITLEIITL